jgi:hypothetical protein
MDFFENLLDYQQRSSLMNIYIYWHGTGKISSFITAHGKILAQKKMNDAVQLVNLYFIPGWSWVQISKKKPITLTGNFTGFLQSFRPSLSKITSRLLLSICTKSFVQ